MVGRRLGDVGRLLPPLRESGAPSDSPGLPRVDFGFVFVSLFLFTLDRSANLQFSPKGDLLSGELVSRAFKGSF